MQEKLDSLTKYATAYTRRWVRWDLRLSWLNLLFAATATILTALAAAGPLQGKSVATHLSARTKEALGQDAGWKAVCWTAAACSAIATALMFSHKGLRCTSRISDGAGCVAALELIDPKTAEATVRKQLAALKQKHPEIFFGDIP